MTDHLEAKDDNLRLVFSEEHSEWLDAKIVETKRAIAVLLIFLGLGFVGILSQMSNQQSGLFMFSVALSVIAALELIRRLFGLKKYRVYTEDHQDFLKKYNRL